MGKKRQNPETSIEAYKSVTPEMRNKHHGKILNALKVLGGETAEGIAIYLKMQHSQINRRVSEMDKLKLIYRPGTRKKTVTGRWARVWCICGAKNTETENIYANGQKTSTDYSKELIKSTRKKEIIHNPLFD